MKIKQMTIISWRGGSEEGEALSDKLEWLTEKLSKVSFNYMEWRPGTGLLNPEAGHAPIFAKGLPVYKKNIAIDELRLFSKDAGLHAIDDAGTTRWMQWCLGEGSELKQRENWTQVKVEATENQIVMLDKVGASRFGVDAGLPDENYMIVQEYRVGGSLFCWNLKRSNSQ